MSGNDDEKSDEDDEPENRAQDGQGRQQKQTKKSWSDGAVSIIFDVLMTDKGALWQTNRQSELMDAVRTELVKTGVSEAAKRIQGTYRMVSLRAPATHSQSIASRPQLSGKIKSLERQYKECDEKYGKGRSTGENKECKWK